MVTDELLKQAVENALKGASDNFETDGYCVSAVFLFDEDGECKAIANYEPDTREAIAGLIAEYRAKAAVLAGEVWYRKLPKGEPRQYLSLADDPQAGEQLIAASFQAGSTSSHRVSREIIRARNTAVLGDPEFEVLDKSSSWLLDLLNEFWA